MTESQVLENQHSPLLFTLIALAASDIVQSVHPHIWLSKHMYMMSFIWNKLYYVHFLHMFFKSHLSYYN
ncbi:hypothetical protein O6P43_020367 [Quillaja saponaria]|uniref:Uncharacterized protein n=1 Tax=Quillaja saponaria TaxID=32244 RepID=A0AAD7LKG2_QUISA|nr:hypothetical protein O6P43_020367 [Quillaja saponaria]